MASIQERTSRDGTPSYRVGYMHDPTGSGKRRLCWTHSVATPEAAVEMKGLFEKLGPELALATIAARTGRDVVTGPPLLSEWLEKHLAGLGAHATPGTIAGYRAEAARTWLPTLGPMPLDKIEREHITAWVAAQRQTETARSVKARARALAEGRTPPEPVMCSVKTIANAHGSLSSVLASAVAKGHIPTNVARGVKMPSDAEGAQREKLIFTEAEWTTFYEAFQPHYRPLVLFLVATGARIGEASAVQVHDLDLSATAVTPDGRVVPQPAVHIRRAWKKGERGTYLGAPKSKRGIRTILISQALAAVLAPLAEGRRGEELVFTAVRGGKVQAHRFRERQWERAMAKAGITKELTPHSLRHTSASWLLMKGVAPTVVQHRLGHESLNTTSKVYGHLLIDAQASAVAATAHVLDRIAAPPQIEG